MMFRDVSPAMKHACFTSYETCFLVKTFIINNLHQFPFLFLYYCHCLPPNPVISPVDGWTIAFQANGPQGAWTTLWTGVDGPKRQPAHGPDHRDCPHPRAFAHAPHRAKGVTGSPYRVFMVTVTVNQEAGQRLRRGPRLRGSVSNGGLPTPLLHNTKSIHTRRARVGDKTILKQRLMLAAVRVE